MATIRLYDYIQSELVKKGLNEFVDNQGNLVFFDKQSQFMTKILSYDEDIVNIVNDLFVGYGLNDPEHDTHFKKSFFYRFIQRNIGRQTIEAFQFQLISTFMTNENYINRVYGDLERYLYQTSNNEQINNQTNKETNESTNVQNNKQTNTSNNSQTNVNNNLQENDQRNTQNTNQTNEQAVNGNNTTDNREADASLPQDDVQLDVNSTIMTTADSNRISRNKQLSNQNTTGTTDSDTTGTTLAKTVGESTDVISGENSGETIGLTDNVSNGLSEGISNSQSTGESKVYKLDELFKTKNLHEQIYNIFDKKCFSQVW